MKELARWAANLEADAIPARLREAARLQQLSVAAAIHHASALPLADQLQALTTEEGDSPTLLGQRHSPREALRLHATLAAALDFSDHSLGGSLGPALCAGWLFPEASLEALLEASVLANEVGGRLGLATLLEPSSREPQRLAVASAVLCARLSQLEPRATESAIALALELSGGPPSTEGDPVRALRAGSAVVAGWEASQLARGGAAASLPDTSELLEGLGCELGLRPALGGAGKAWISDTLVFKLQPVQADLLVAVQAVAEILRRHLRAADRPLRPEQWQSCTVRLPFSVADAQHGRSPALSDASRSLASTLALLALDERLCGATYVDADPRFDALRGLVEIRDDLALSTRFARTTMSRLAPLFGELDRPARLRAFARLCGPLRAPSRKELEALFRNPPVRWFLERLDRGTDFGGLDLQAYRYFMPVQVRLGTTRGGFWPERRAAPEGHFSAEPEAVAAAVQGKLEAWAPDTERGSAPASSDPVEAWLVHLGAP